MKRNLFLTTATVLMLGTGMAMAQSSPGTATDPATQPSATSQTSSGSASGSSQQAGATGNAVSLEKMMGKDVYGSDGQKLGSIEDFILDPQTGAANVAVLQHGGVLGVGGKSIAVDYNLLTMDGDRIVVEDITQAQLDAMPEFEYDDSAVSMNRGRDSGGQQNQGGNAPPATPKQ